LFKRAGVMERFEQDKAAAKAAKTETSAQSEA
jgi:hypothetical protein